MTEFLTESSRGAARELTFFQASLCGGEHLINSEGISSLFVAFVLHFFDVWQAVHGTAEISLPRLWIWTVYAWLVFTYTDTKTENNRRLKKRDHLLVQMANHKV